MSTRHSKAAETYLQNEAVVTRHDKTFFGVRQKRDNMAKALPEWEDLREAASQIKKHTATHLADYLEKFERNATNNGVIVHWAQDADEYNKIVYDILSKHKVRKVVKSKSMLTEECHLNEKCFREKISNFEEISKSYGKPHDDPNDPTFLTYVARMHLRQQFAEADCGMTGANFGIAETGDVVVCTNEGNADMSTSIPKLHIVSMGIEKLIPDYKAMGVFQRFVARSGTGQETTVYTSHFRGPRPGGEMHIVLVDNGRSDILGNPEHWQTLKCMRCGACMNTCPVYRRSAGYSYTYFIPGPIGINLGMLRDKHKYHDNVSACSLCCSCDNVCPVKVDLSSQVYRWRQELDDYGHADPMKRMMSKGMSFLFNHPALYTTALRMSPMANWVPGPLMNLPLNPWAYGHEMMKFPKKSFHQLWSEDLKSKEK